MAETANNPLPLEDEDQIHDETLSEHFMDWIRTELVWYAGSFSFHLLLLSFLLLVPRAIDKGDQGDAPVYESKAEPEKKEEKIPEKMDIGEPDPTPPPILDINPNVEKPAQQAVEAEYNDDSKTFEHKGGGTAAGLKDAASAGGGALAFGPGPKVTGTLGIGVGVGTGKDAGSGGAGSGFGGRGSGSRQKMLAQGGGTARTERAVAAALLWLAHHQDYDGHWGLAGFVHQCKDKSCAKGKSVSEITSCDSGATAMGLLPFLAAGQTHKTKGTYRETVLKGVQWLIAHQQPDGDLAKGAQQKMYSHGLATIALCEAFGLTGDPEVRGHAQAAVNYILAAQNAADGGWRYNPKDPGDTSVVGWQLMALKSAHMAGLDVGGTSSGSAFMGTSKWLDSVSVNNGTEYAYMPGQGPEDTMTSVGLLCRQYLGAKRDNPWLVGGMQYLRNHLPDENRSNIYYWYYATQVMHNMAGYEWDEWNRKMRDILVHTQVRSVDECANGSWDPTNDHWGSRGGRVMQTSLSALTLEIYYRYLPLFKAEAGAGAGAEPAKGQVLGGGEAKPAKGGKAGKAGKPAKNDNADKDGNDAA
jgi:hypothetical protein